jgi:hypothetical protein
MRFGIEVWFPRTLDEKQGVARLHGVLVDALRESLGIARSHPMSYSRRNCKASALLCDFGLPSMSTEGDSALVRLYSQRPPSLHPFTIVTISTPPLLPFYRPTTLGGYTFELSLPGCTRDPSGNLVRTGGHKDQHCTTGEHCTFLAPLHCS